MIEVNGIKHSVMLDRASALIKRDYRSRCFYCKTHGIDKGNLSKALNDKYPLSNSMIEPLGYEKVMVPVYRKIKK